MEINPNAPQNTKEILATYEKIAKVVQTDEEVKYVGDITPQHFKSENDPETKSIGSCVYTETCPNGAFGLLELAADRLGDDDSEDRKKLLAKGAPASSLLPFARYYMVEGIRGKCRIVPISAMKDDTEVTLIKSPKGAPSLVIEESKVPAEYLQDVNYATIILGPEKRPVSVVENGQTVEKEEDGMAVWTMHAGYPVPMVPIERGEKGPVRDADGSVRVPDSFGWKYNDKLTVAQVREKMGPDAFISIV
jgi:hypothetical protein